MTLKKIKLTVKQGKKPINPQEIFNKLTLRGSIENIWQPQSDALDKWHKTRSNQDTVIQMNTGGGKTLVGLLIAQSLVNETKGSVLYVCPNNQLVEQIKDRAKEIALSPAIRYKGKWEGREDYEAGNTFCVTNYATVFHGTSLFRNDNIDALIFDDAHVAEDAIRNQFTLKIERDHKAFGKILHLFRDHFAKTSHAERFEDITEGRFTSSLFIPMFVTWKHAQMLRRILIDCKIADKKSTMFIWEHLKEHLNLCAIVIDGNGLEITPAVLPLTQLSYFQDEIRRVYLTATLPSRASFVRTFGVENPTVIQPSGKSGDAQRLFVFVPGDDDAEQRNEALELVKDYKSCVISPSNSKGQEWDPPATIYDKDSGQEGIDRFRHSQEPEMLGLIARYDGIDLPGDSCRILILDRLPTGESLLNRFIDENMRIETIRITNITTRLVQAIGRIFRSNTDHGVVLLVGQTLQAWVRTPKNRAYLPKLLQQQILLSIELAKLIKDGETTREELIQGVLNGDDNWDELYNSYINQFETGLSSADVEWHIKLILKEKEAYEKLWVGQYQQASDLYSEIINMADIHDQELAAWYHHWRGLALLCADDNPGALHEFIVAANNRSELGRPSMKRDHVFHLTKPESISAQANALAKWYRKRKRHIQDALRQVEVDMIYGSETKKTEEAFVKLGNLLGLQANRPDKTDDTGPDVVWEGENDLNAIGFELKTDKQKDGEYYKRDISQCHDHAKWLSNHYNNNYLLYIVGPRIPVSHQSNPPNDLQFIEIEPFRDLLERVKSMHEAVEAGDKANLEQAFQSWLDYFGLTWPTCIKALDNTFAIDLLN